MIKDSIVLETHVVNTIMYSDKAAEIFFFIYKHISVKDFVKDY